MADIIANNIPGCTVYGVQQMTYTVEGVAGRDYGRALAAISLTRAASIERQAQALTGVARLRQKKVEELGNALAEVSAKLANAGSDAKVTDDATLPASAASVFIRYGVKSTCKTRGDLMKIQSDAKYALDTESNNLQQTMLSVQNMMTKRDQAFSSASSLMKKVGDGVARLINEMGG